MSANDLEWSRRRERQRDHSQCWPSKIVSNSYKGLVWSDLLDVSYIQSNRCVSDLIPVLCEWCLIGVQ